MTIQEFMIEEEGERFKAYHDTEGNHTIGVGRNLDGKGISKDESRYLLNNDIEEAVRDLVSIFPNWEHMTFPRQMAFISMHINLGPTGFRGFHRMISAAMFDDWKRAAYECLHSEAGRKLEARYMRLSKMILTGEEQKA